jgi:hypothetical protein
MTAEGKGAELCSANDNGVSVDVVGPAGLMPGSLVAFVAQHVRVLGPDPAHWTARVIVGQPAP